MIHLAKPSIKIGVQAAPGAGLPQEFTGFEEGAWCFKHIAFTFDTDANAANRLLSISLTHNGVTLQIAQGAFVVTANQIVNYYIGEGIQRAGSLAESYEQIPLPTDMLLGIGPTTGDILTLEFANIQVTDTIGDTSYIAHTFITEQLAEA